MLNQVSPAQVAKCVLSAFPYAYAGADTHFRRSGNPPADAPKGILYAVISGWVERTQETVLRLIMGGVAALGKHTSVPKSTYFAWAHH